MQLRTTQYLLRPGQLLHHGRSVLASFFSLATVGLPLCALVALGGMFPSVGKAETASSLNVLESRVERWTLDNGIRVLFVRQENAPVFAGQVWVKVGGVDERPGITGIAHFLEHMAFKGSQTIGTKDYHREAPLLAELESLIHGAENQSKALESKRAQEILHELSEIWVDNEFGKLYSNAGAVGLNAMTSKDYTAYVVRLPSVAFEMWCWMESDRLLAPVFRQFYKEREVVQEERRNGYDDDPGGRLYESLLQTAFQSHPQRLPVIGYSEDLKKITATQMREFYDREYTPQKIVLSIVGNLEPKLVRELTEKYFGRFPKKRSQEATEPSPEPEQTAAREVVLRMEAQPQIFIAYHKPTLPDPADGHFAVLHALLSDGRSSRLHRTLVEEKKLLLGVETGEAPGERYPNLFYVAATPAPGVSAERVVEAVQHELDRIQTEPPTEQELLEAKKRSRISYLKVLDSDSGLASALGKNEALHGDWRALLNIYEHLEATTKEEIVELRKSYLGPEHRTVAKIEQEGR